MDRDAAQLPREQLPIALFDGVVLAVRQVRTLECLLLDDVPL